MSEAGEDNWTGILNVQHFIQIRRNPDGKRFNWHYILICKSHKKSDFIYRQLNQRRSYLEPASLTNSERISSAIAETLFFLVHNCPQIVKSRERKLHNKFSASS